MAHWCFRSAVLLIALLLAGCTSGSTTASSNSSTTTASQPTPTTEPGLRSGEGLVVATTNPVTETSVVPTTTTTTTTTTTVPSAPVNIREELRVDPVFNPLLDELIELTRVPIRLPESLGVEGIATLNSVEENSYTITLGVGPDCNGGNVCRIGTFSARRGESLDPLVPPGTAVPLPNELRGEFLDATCGANCGDGFVQWIEDGVTYSVGAKLAPGPAMLQWAWSAVDPQATAPRPPEFCGPHTVADNGRVADVVADDEADVHWLVVCAEEGIEAEVVPGDGQLRWINLGSQGNDLLYTANGESMIFSVRGVTPQALIDGETFGRFVGKDLRCVDLSGDGVPEIVDGRNGRTVQLANWATRLDDHPDPTLLPSC